MAQTDYKLKITRSRDDHELYQVALLKYDPSLISRLLLQLAPAQRIRPQQPVAKLLPKPRPNNCQEQPQPIEVVLSINYAGTVECVGEGFQRAVWEGEEVFALREGQGRGRLELFWFRECDHSPREERFLNGSFGEQVKKGYSQSVAVCEWCQAALWKYYDRQEVAISLAELCRLNSLQDVRQAGQELEWSIALNEQFTNTTEVGRVGEAEITLPFLAKATFLLGVGERRRVGEETVVMRLRRVVCKHEKVVEGRCQFCMEQVREEHLSQFSTYLFQQEGGGVLVTGSALKHHEQIFVDNLLAQTKAIIILDLDNTILHSTEISELDLRTVMALDEFYLIPKLDCAFEQEKGRRDLIVVKMRPYFRQFIYVLTKLYEIYVYTKGTRVYAQEICRYIRAQYAGEQRAHPYVTWQPEKLLFLQHKKSFATNIISRDEDSSLDSKSFERILPTKTDYHLILDDRRDVWNNSPSWFFTREYYYFLNKTKRSHPDPADDIAHYLATAADIPLPEIKGQLLEDYQQIKQQYPEKKDLLMQTNHSKDYFLLFAAYALKKIHRNFFEALGQEERQRQGGSGRSEAQREAAGKRKFNKINLAYQYARTKVFYKGYKFQFFLGEGQNENNNNTIRRAKKMGAAVAEESPKLSTCLEHIVIRANDLMKQTKKAQGGTTTTGCQGEYYEKQKKQLNELFLKKIPVVCQSWIHYCYEYNYPFAYDEFRLFDPFQVQVNHEDYSHVVEKQAKLILNSIDEEMAKEMGGEKEEEMGGEKEEEMGGEKEEIGKREAHQLHGVRHRRQRKEEQGHGC